MNFDYLIPVYNHLNQPEGEMKASADIEHARKDEMRLTTKGRGRHYRITSAHWMPRKNLSWRVKDSGGYQVMQLVNG